MFRTLVAVAVCLVSAGVPAAAASPPSGSSPLQATLAQAAPGETDPIGRLHGVIRNAKTGDPINGACLEVAEFTSGQPPILATVCTGPTGAYEMTLSATKTYRINVRADGYQSRWLPNKVLWSEAAVNVTQGGDRELDGALGEDVGILRGTVTRQDGQPDAFAIVSVYRPGAGTALRTIQADVAGRFSRDNLPVGSYELAFAISGYPTQWHPSTTDRTKATAVTISSELPKTVDEQAIALATPPTTVRKPGSIAGQVTKGGVPVSGATVKANLLTTETDADGRYTFSGLPPTNYYISVTGPGLPEWWSGGKLTPALRNLFPGANIVVDLPIPAKYGTVQGVLKDFDGTFLPDNSIQLFPAGITTHIASTNARFDGSFEFRGVPEGSYLLRFFARGKYQERTVTVADGQTVELVETLPAPTFIAVKVVDVGTGAPVAGKYVSAATTSSHLGQATTGADGTAVIGPIWDFTAQHVNVYGSQSTTHFRAEGGMEALPGVINHITLQADPGATIRMPVVRKDGTSYSGLLCIYARALPFGEEQPGEKHVCGFMEADQTVLLGPLKTGSYRLLVMPAKPFGAQWFGPNGGTGIPEEALVFKVETSKTTSTPTVRLDPGHTLLARVNDGKNPLPDSCAYIVPNTYFLGACTDSNGLIQIEDLGPYKWPVLFRNVTSWNYEAAWYGGTGSRMFATPVQLPMQTEVKMTLKAAGRLHITVPPWDGADGAILRAFDAYTGDYVDGGCCTLNQLGNGRVVLAVQTATQTCWLTAKNRIFRFGMPYFSTAAGKDNVLSGLSCTQQEPLLLKPVSPGRLFPATRDTTPRTAVLQGKQRGHSA